MGTRFTRRGEPDSASPVPGETRTSPALDADRAQSDPQQAVLLEMLRGAEGAPVSYTELREAGIEFPASVVSELELAGAKIERCDAHAGALHRVAGVRLDPAGETPDIAGADLPARDPHTTLAGLPRALLDRGWKPHRPSPRSRAPSSPVRSCSALCPWSAAGLPATAGRIVPLCPSLQGAVFRPRPKRTPPPADGRGPPVNRRSRRPWRHAWRLKVTRCSKAGDTAKRSQCSKGR